MTLPPFSRLIHIVIAGALLPVMASAAAAQSATAHVRPGRSGTAAPTPNRAPTQGARWRFGAALTGAIGYDDNVFLLPERRKSSLGAPTAAEERSGRYVDMKSARDAVGSLEGVLRVTARGYGGRPLEVRPSADLEMHALNPALTNATVGLALEQELARDGRVRGRATYTPNAFRRNYFMGATDENGDGGIDAGERRYGRAEASDLKLVADYRHRLRKARRASPVGVAAQLGAGIERRRHASPFAARDYRGPVGEARLLLDLTKSLALDVGYGIARLDATPTQEIMLTGDGATRGTVSGIADRSRTEHTVSARVRTNLTRRTDLSIEAERRARTFTSQEPSDLRYRGRRDSRNAIDAELTSRLRSGVRAVGRVRAARQTLVRGGSPVDDEVDDYTRLRAAVGLRLTF